VEVDPEEPAVLNYTSGSTGALKAAVQSYGNRLANVRKRLMSPSGAPTEGERYLAPGPITHASGMMILAVFARGGTTVILPAFDPVSLLQTVQCERITSVFMVPTMLTMLMDHPRFEDFDLSSLRCVGLGGAPIAPQRLRAAWEHFGPIIMQGYGLGETTSAITVLTFDDVTRACAGDDELLGSCGRPLFDTEVRVVADDGTELPPREIGEIVAKGPDCVQEYWGEPQLSTETFRAGWVHTGDLGYFREDGYLFIVDRMKDMIISGGFNIYCSEVEGALTAHPAVAEACVVGVPDPKWGEAVKAVVVLRRDSQGDIATELIAYCAERLARMKRPQTIDFVQQLPLNRNGKVDRRRVRAPYWEGQARSVS
jgi:acyl-CoA synthetase (AMP-forming)/AMP-acid ligase II